MTEAILAGASGYVLKDGPVEEVVAGIQAAKRTDELIPLCHSLPLSFVGVEADVDGEAGVVTLTAEARWGKQHFLYKALEYPRTFRAPLYVLVYPIACGWCRSRRFATSTCDR